MKNFSKLYLDLYCKGVGEKFDSETNRSKYVYFQITNYIENEKLLFYLAFPYKNKGFGEEIAAHIFSHVVKAVMFLHKNNISHGDINLNNVLVDENFNLHLIDFGFSTIDQKLSYQHSSTSKYAGPEVKHLVLEYYDPFKSDVFSLGVFLYLLVFRHYPFEDCDQIRDKIFREVYFGGYSVLWYREFEISDELKDLFKKTICYKPKDRISLKEITEHPWIHKFFEPESDILKKELKERLKMVKIVKAKIENPED